MELGQWIGLAICGGNVCWSRLVDIVGVQPQVPEAIVQNYAFAIFDSP
jgi:hypothetical protein